MIASRSSRGAENFSQLDGFRLQFTDLFWRNQRGSFCQFNPQIRFVGFLQNDCNFVDEISMRFSTQRRAIIRRHRTTAARYLTGNRSSRWFVWEGVGKFENPDGKFNGPFFKFNGIHMPLKFIR